MSPHPALLAPTGHGVGVRVKLLQGVGAAGQAALQLPQHRGTRRQPEESLGMG